MPNGINIINLYQADMPALFFKSWPDIVYSGA